MKRFGPMFYSMSAANLLFFLGNSLFILFPVFLKDLGAAESYIGVMNNIDKVMVILTAVVIGSALHGRKRLRILRFGYGALIAVYASYLFISSPGWLVPLIRIAHGAGFSIAMILGSTIIFEIVPIEHAAEAIGIYGVTGAISNAVSPWVGEQLILHGHSHRTIFIIASCCVAASFFLSLFMKEPVRKVSAAAPEGGSVTRLFRDGRYVLVSLMSFIFGGGFGTIITYLPNFVRTTTSLRYSYFFVVYIAVLIMIRFTFMRIVGGIDRNRLLASVFVVAFFSNFILNFLTSLPVLVLVGILYGITHGILYPVLNAITVAIVPEKDRGASNALFTAVFNGGMMVFALSLGFLVDARGSYLAAFNVSAFACLAGAAVVALFSLRYGGVEVSADESTAIIPKE